MNGGTAEAIRYTIGFDDKEAKQSASKIHSILEKMDKMVEALGKKAIIAKNKMMEATRAITSLMSKAFQVFKDAMMKVFAPVIWLKDKFLSGFRGIQRIFQGIADVVRKIEGYWFSIHQRGLGYMRTLLGVGEEHKRHSKELEKQDGILKRMVDKAKEYEEALRAAAMATPAVALATKASVDVSNLQRLVREGFSQEFVNKLPAAMHGIAAKTGTSSDMAGEAFARLAERGTIKGDDKILKFAEKAVLYAKELRVPVADIVNQMTALNDTYDLSLEQIEKLMNGYREGARTGRASLEQMGAGMTEGIELLRDFSIKGGEASKVFLENFAAIKSALAGTPEEDIVKSFMEKLKGGLDPTDPNAPVLASFMGLNVEGARQLLQSGKIAEVMDKVVGGLNKALEMGDFQKLDMLKVIFGDEEGTKLITQLRLKEIDLLEVHKRLQEAFKKPLVASELSTTEKWKAIWERVKEIVSKIGALLMPIYNKFVDVIYKWFMKLTDPDGPLQNMIVKIGYLGSLFMALIAPIKWLGGVIMSFIVIPLTTFFIGKLLGGLKGKVLEKIFMPIATFFHSIGNSAKIASTWVGVLFRGIGDFFKIMAGQKYLKTVWAFFEREFPKVTQAFRLVGGRIVWVTAIITELYSTVKKFFDLGGGKNIADIFSFDTSLTDKVKAFLGMLDKLWDSLSLIGKLAFPAVAWISNWANSIMNHPGFNAVMEKIQYLWEGIKGRLEMSFNALKVWITGIYSWVVETATQIAAPFVSMFDTVKGKIIEFWDWLKELGTKIKEWFRSTLGFDPTAGFTWLNKILDKFGGNLIEEGKARVAARKAKEAAQPPGAAQGSPPVPQVRPNAPPASGQPSKGAYDAQIAAAATKYGIPEALLRAQIKQESNFNPNAVSKAGAAGLMQLMPGTAKDLGLSEQDRFDPSKNIDAGAKYLAQQYKKFGSWELALAAYNAGPGNVQKYGNQIPPFAETQDYVSKITTNWDQMSSLPTDNTDAYTQISRQETPKTTIQQEEVVSELVRIRALLERQLTMVVGPSKLSGTPNGTPTTGVANELATAAM